MTYFTTRDLAGVTIFATLWGILNDILSPIFFQLFGLPFLCDIIGFSALILAIWWVRKLGTATFVGFVALIINLLLRPTALHFFGFFMASILFDVLTFLGGYERLFKKGLFGSAILFTISVFSAGIAGLIIALFFMDPSFLAGKGGILAWAALHAVGGVIGGALGVSLLSALKARGLSANFDILKQP